METPGILRGDDQVEIFVPYDGQGDRELLEEAAGEAGVTTGAVRGFVDGGASLLLIGAGSLVVGAISGWLARRSRKGERSWGQVIDLRPGEDLIKRDEDLEFGQIVIITPTADGRTMDVRVETYDPDNDFTAIAKLVFGTLADGVIRPLDALVTLATEAVGDKASVTITQHAASQA